MGVGEAKREGKISSFPFLSELYYETKLEIVLRLAMILRVRDIFSEISTFLKLTFIAKHYLMISLSAFYCCGVRACVRSLARAHEGAQQHEQFEMIFQSGPAERKNIARTLMSAIYLDYYFIFLLLLVNFCKCVCTFGRNIITLERKILVCCVIFL